MKVSVSLLALHLGFLCSTASGQVFKGHKIGETAEQFFSIARMAEHSMLTTQYCKDLTDPKASKSHRRPALDVNECMKVRSALEGNDVEIGARYAIELGPGGSATFDKSRLVVLIVRLEHVSWEDVVTDVGRELGGAEPARSVATEQNAFGGTLQERRANWNVNNLAVQADEVRDFRYGNLGVLVTVADSESLKEREATRQATRPSTIQALGQQKPKISDAFAKASLFALKAISSDATIPENANGELMASRHTTEKIDAADVEAVTPQEKFVVGLLHDFYSDRLINNTRRDTIRVQYEEKAYSSPASGLALQRVPDELAKDPRIVGMTKREAACSDAVDAMLRLRVFDAPEECKSVTLSKEESAPTPTQPSALPEAMKQAIVDNSEAAKTSPAAAASLANVGHTHTPQEMAQLVQTGQASRCGVVTNPAGAEVYVDGNKAGITPLAFVLLRQGDSPRTITIKMPGYKTVEKTFVPDGKTIPIGLTLEKIPSK